MSKKAQTKAIDYYKVPPDIFNKHWQELVDSMNNIEQSLLLLAQGIKRQEEYIVKST